MGGPPPEGLRRQAAAPIGVTRPTLWTPRLDKCDRFVTEEKRHSTRDEYRYLLCYGVFYLCRALDDRRRHGNASHALTGDHKVAERLVYRRFFDTAVADCCANGVDGLLASLDDKRLEVSLLQAAKAHASYAFKAGGDGGGGGACGGGGGSCASTIIDNMTEKDHKAQERKKREEADRKKAAKLHTDRRTSGQGCAIDRGADRRLTLAFLEPELARFLACGAWEYGSRRDFVSRAFLVPKLGGNWRFIIDLRHLNSYRVRKRIRMETLMGLRHLTKKGDYMHVLLRPQGASHADAGAGARPRSLCPHPLQPLPAAHARWRGARILPYVDDFLHFADTEAAAAVGVRARQQRVLDALGPERHAEKGSREPAQFGLHLGINIDSATGVVFYAPEAKLLKPASHAKQLRRDMQWWTAVPTQANRKPIHRPVETAYLHTDSSGSGWGCTMARYATYLGNLRTIKSTSLQPYMSAFNGSFHDHGLAAMAVAPLVSKVRKGMKASHVSLYPEAFAGGRLPAASWAVEYGEKARLLPPTYIIGVMMQNINHFGGWGEESDMVLDYIDPSRALPYAAARHLFGRMTPWGALPAIVPRQLASWWKND
eukprot:jgi/Tetstr1/429072/TSEL_019036.t1